MLVQVISKMDEKGIQYNSDLLLVVPIYNEEKILGKKLNELYFFLIKSGIDFLLVLAVDKSGDKSLEISKSFADEHERVVLLFNSVKKGRGYAVREAWLRHNAALYSFIDADLATGLDVIEKAYRTFLSSDCDVITASRYCRGALVQRPQLRNAVSRIYNQMLRLIFKGRINDYQCGFKMIKREVRDSILKRTHINSWFWDTELLIKSSFSGFDVKELPVEWMEKKYVKTSFRRLVNDVGIHGYGIMRLYRDINFPRETSESEIHDENRLVA